MNEYKLVLQKAFEEVEARELKSIEENSSEWDYSPEFERKMNKLVKAQKHSCWKFVNTASKRVAVIAILIVVSFFCTMSVGASKNAIIEFFKDEFKTHTQITFSADEDDTDYIPKCIEKSYTIKQIPTNFKKTFYYTDNGQVVTEWTNSDKKNIVLHQCIIESIQSYDTEGTFIKEIKINAFTVYTYSKRGYTTYIWEENGYIFTLYLPNEISRKLARSCIGNMIPVN